ncbi:MAG TPA: NUDIX hydrolase, partial [Myxococcota bacterium]
MVDPHKQQLLPWDEVEEGLPDRRRVFTVRSDVVRSQKTGKQLTVDRLIAADWVNVVCVTDDDKLVLVRQWRFGARAFTLELPAGLMERDEEPLVAGLRELREETGYAPPAPDKARVVGSVNPNPAFMRNTCHTVVVAGAARVSEQNLDPTEDIEIITVPVADVDAIIRRGELNNALSL